MKAGILAAGLGERLSLGGINTAKPLVPLAGEPMIARTIRAAAELGATSVACIVNQERPEVATFLRDTTWPIPLELVERTTPNSMESLFALEPHLDKEPFLLFTVDAVCAADTLALFLAAAQQLPASGGVLALTRFIDDEKPLWVRTDPEQRILALGEDARASGEITAGFYYFQPGVFTLIDEARRRGLKALRQFLALATESGRTFYGVEVGKTIDVDHPRDIETAENWLRNSHADT